VNEEADTDDCQGDQAECQLKDCRSVLQQFLVWNAPTIEEQQGRNEKKQSPLDVSCSARKPVRRAESTAPTSSEAGRPLDEISHVGCGMYGQRMMGKARPRRNITGHFASHFELLIRCRGEQRNQQILQRDDPDAQRDKLGVAHFRSWNLFFVSRCGHDGTSGPSFVLPSR
jgi:hypothetical protein